MTTPDIAAVLRTLREAHEVSAQGEWKRLNGCLLLVIPPGHESVPSVLEISSDNARAIALAHNLLPDLIAVAEAADSRPEGHHPWCTTLASERYSCDCGEDATRAALARLAGRGT